MKKIYISCPAHTATGGPELLHQLCYKLTKIGYESYMYYYDIKKNKNPLNDRYIQYNTSMVNTIEDDENNIVIVPETNINLLKKIRNAKKCIWWLSVDNYISVIKSKKYKLKYMFGLLELKYNKHDIIHLCQSKYAIEFLLKQNIDKNNIFYLSDYINNQFIRKSLDNINYNKLDYVLYNPKKGYNFTKKIIANGRNINWIALENMSLDQMSEIMKKSKVYIDFGHHPGKDRIPREAAISGCCIITSKRGSAKYKEDVYIDDEYKFDDIDENIDNIVSKIEHLIENYEIEINKFRLYREKIMNEENEFEKDIKKVFSKIL